MEQKTKENILYDNFLMRYFSSIYNNSSFNTCEIKNIAEVKNGYTFKPSEYLEETTFNDNILEVLKMGHISINGGLKLNPKKDYVERNEKISKYILNENDIVLGMTDMKDKVVILGVPALIDKSNYYVLNQRVARIISNTNNINPIILYYQMRQQEFINTLRTKANSGVQVNLTTDSIKNMIVKVPTQNEQHKIIKQIAPLVEIQKINNIEIKKLQDLKQKYLNKFFG